VALAVAAEVGLSAQPESFLLQRLAQEGRAVVTGSLTPTLFFQGDKADLGVLGGVLALERGQPAVAGLQFEEALRTGHPTAGPWREFATRELADAYLQRIRAAE
jgi:hypothetical protein